MTSPTPQHTSSSSSSPLLLGGSVKAATSPDGLCSVKYFQVYFSHRHSLSLVNFFPQHTLGVAGDLLAFLFLSPGILKMLTPSAGLKKRRGRKKLSLYEQERLYCH